MLFLNETLELQDTDLHIYNYICSNLNSVIYMRIRELSLATNVSTTTILRFCKKFHCGGYSEFKYKLQEYANKAKDVTMEKYDEASNILFMKRLQNNEFKSLLHKAAKIISDSDLLFFIGLGSSGIIAKYGQYLFSSLVTLSIAVNDPLNTPLYHLSKNFNGRICLLALSVSGEQDDIIEFIDSLKMHDARIISVTNKDSSAIARFSDINISCHTSQEKYYNMDITSQVPVLALLEALAREVHVMKYPRS